ncbi:hypothetical protein DH2020_037124 [Rehmannia glutinosa]|uniref:Dof zinc finger protein n=1 Tax=Rehmannia glutinosa TaxID=99300 RepID=A0ABR0V4Y9_REHGL
MEQAREIQQQEQPPTPLKCPRCRSPDTKFRYFNNHSLTQPRHYCKTCKRQWTVGGNLRNIPVGGKTRSGKQTKASSSRCGNPTSQHPQPPLPLGEEHLQNSQSLTPMAAMVPQNFDGTMIQPTASPPAAVSPLSSYYFNDEISCLDAIQLLIQPEVINQHVNAGNQFGTGGANMAIPQEWNTQPMASQQALPQQIPRHIESHQTYSQANNGPPSHLNNNSLVQPTWPMNSLPQEIPNNFGVSTSNACLWNNIRGNTTDMEMDTTSVNIDEWLNFSDHDSP